MHPVIFLGLWVAIAFILFKMITCIANYWGHIRQAKQLGCKPAPIYNRRDPFGIHFMLQSLKALREKRLLDLHVKRVQDISAREGRQVTTMRYTIAGQQIIYTSDPKNVQAVLATQFKDFEMGQRRTENFRPLLGHGIFASNGKQWEESRALLRPQLARDQTSDLYLQERDVQHLMKAIPTNHDGWTDIVNIQPLFFRLTIDTVTGFLFGESVESQRHSLPNYSAGTEVSQERDERLFALAFDKVQWQLAGAFAFGDLWWLGHTPDFGRNCRDVHTFVDYYVQLALKKEPYETQAEYGDKKEKYVFLDALAAQTQDPIELRSQILNILLAGRDTTASLLSWVFLLLAQHAENFNQLRRVIIEEFGDYCDDVGEITFARLKGCSFLQYTLHETLRLYPVVPLNGRLLWRLITSTVGEITFCRQNK